MQFLVHVLIISSNWIPLALAYNLLFGKGKVLNFGPIGVSLAVGYALYLPMMATGSYFLGMLVALLFAIALSAFFTWLSLRLDPDGLGVMSIAVHLAILAVILNWTSLTRGALGLPRIPRVAFLDTLPAFALAAALATLCWILLFSWIERSAISRQMTALAEHEWHAAALGVCRASVHFVAFLLVGLAAISGTFFYGQYLHLFYPTDFQFPAFIFLIMIVVTDKPGSFIGCIVSTFLLVFLKEGLRFLPLADFLAGPLQLILFGVILFAAVWWRKGELFPVQRQI